MVPTITTTPLPPDGTWFNGISNSYTVQLEKWKFCPTCGKSLEPLWNYCSGCGRAIGSQWSSSWVIPSIPAYPWPGYQTVPSGGTIPGVYGPIYYGHCKLANGTAAFNGHGPAGGDGRPVG